MKRQEYASLVLGAFVMGFEILAFKAWGAVFIRGPVFLIVPLIFFGAAVGSVAVGLWPRLGLWCQRYMAEISAIGLALGALSLAVLDADSPLVPAVPLAAGLVANVLWGACATQLFADYPRSIRLLLFSTAGTLAASCIAPVLQVTTMSIAGSGALLLGVLACAGLGGEFDRIRTAWIVSFIAVAAISLATEIYVGRPGVYSNFYSELKVSPVIPGMGQVGLRLQPEPEAKGRIGFEDMDVFVIRRNGSAATLVFRGENLQQMVALRMEEPYALLNLAEKGSIAILGAGGGQEIIQAQLAGFAKIVAVEINPLMVKAARDRNRGAPLGYDAPGVQVVVQDARFYFRHLPNDVLFDAILMTNVKNFGSTGKLYFSENHLLTREAIQTYVRHLAPGGRLILRNNGGGADMRNSFFSTILPTLSDVAAPGDEVVVVRLRQNGETKLIGTRSGLALIFKKGGFAKGESTFIRDQFANTRVDVFEGPPSMLARNYGGQIITDDRPYPYWIGGQGGWWNAILVLAFVPLLPLGTWAASSTTAWRAAGSRTETGAMLAAHFSGIGYIGFQTLAIERLVFYSGAPALAPIVAIAVLVLVSVAAFMQLERRPQTGDFRVNIFATACLAALSAYASWILIPELGVVTQNPETQAWMGAALIAVPGYLMAHLFGLLVNTVVESKPKVRAYLKASNGFGYLLGAILIKLVCLEVGHNKAFLVVLAAYGLVGLIAIRSVAANEYVRI